MLLFNVDLLYAVILDVDIIQRVALNIMSGVDKIGKQVWGSK